MDRLFDKEKPLYNEMNFSKIMPSVSDSEPKATKSPYLSYETRNKKRKPKKKDFDKF